MAATKSWGRSYLNVKEGRSFHGSTQFSSTVLLSNRTQANSARPRRSMQKQGRELKLLRLPTMIGRREGERERSEMTE